MISSIVQCLIVQQRRAEAKNKQQNKMIQWKKKKSNTWDLAMAHNSIMNTWRNANMGLRQPEISVRTTRTTESKLYLFFPTRHILIMKNTSDGRFGLLNW